VLCISTKEAFMEIELEFADNAFKHGITEEEIWEVFLNEDVKCLTIKYKKDVRDTIYNAYGTTFSGRYLEVGYVKRAPSGYRIIHAMDMRTSARRRFRRMRRLT
jgi:uncharacterized DUF497 family protein